MRLALGVAMVVRSRNAKSLTSLERLYFLAKIEEGVRQADAGETMSNEEARKRVFG